MSYNISECKTFLTIDDMTFIAIPSDVQDLRKNQACHGCYFLSNNNGCNWVNYTKEFLACISLKGDEPRQMIWLRTH